MEKDKAIKYYKSPVEPNGDHRTYCVYKEGEVYIFECWSCRLTNQDGSGVGSREAYSEFLTEEEAVGEYEKYLTNWEPKNSMELTPEEIIYRQENMVFFVRINIQSEDGKQGKAIAGASRNFIMDTFNIPGNQVITEEHKTRWLEMVLTDLKREITEIDTTRPFLKAYSFSWEGQQNLVKFLSTITP